MNIRKKMRPVAWAELHFEKGAVPCLAKLKDWIHTGVVDGTTVGGIYYIYLDSPIRSKPLWPEKSKRRKPPIGSSSFPTDDDLREFLGS